MLDLLSILFLKLGPLFMSWTHSFSIGSCFLVQPWLCAPVLLTGLLPFPVILDSFLSSIFWIPGFPIPGPRLPITKHLGIYLLPPSSRLLSATQFPPKDILDPDFLLFLLSSAGRLGHSTCWSGQAASDLCQLPHVLLRPSLLGATSQPPPLTHLHPLRDSSSRFLHFPTALRVTVVPGVVLHMCHHVKFPPEISLSA